MRISSARERPMLELYHWEPNGSHLKALIALNEKALPFKSHYMDVPALPNASRETQMNPEGAGPILVHDGRQITESLFLIEYLEDAFPETPLRADDALSHARILAWGRFINEVFMPGASTLGCHQYRAPESSDLLEDSKRKVSLAVRKIEDALANSQWLVGATYSLADIDAFAICNSLPTLTPDVVNNTTTPRLMAWLNRIRLRPAVRAALAVSRTGKPEEAFAPGPEHSRWG